MSCTPRSCIERHRPWQAEYWISGIRDQTLALACLRLGEPAHYAKGADALPAAVRGGLLSLEEACTRYTLTVEEFLAWQYSIDRHGLAGLRTTRIQQYRQ